MSYGYENENTFVSSEEQHARANLCWDILAHWTSGPHYRMPENVKADLKVDDDMPEGLRRKRDTLIAAAMDTLLSIVGEWATDAHS